eukprot:gene19304-25952_t
MPSTKPNVTKLALLVLASLLTLAPAPASCGQDEPLPTIASVASTVPDLSILLKAVSKCTPILDAAQDPDTMVTLFAPTNMAFENALAALGISAEDLLADTETLCDILKYHVVPAASTADLIRSTDATETIIDAPTLLTGQTVAISKVGDDVMVNDAKVVTPDVEIGSNSIVHIIDAVLLPPS